MENLVLNLLNDSSRQSVKKASHAFRAYNNTLRQKILNYMAGKEGVTVTGIYIDLGIDQPVCSQHLAILRKGGLVNSKTDGKYRYYSLNETRLSDLVRLAQQICNL